MSVGGYVGAWSAAEGGAASRGPGRAGLLKIFQILSPDPDPGPIPGPIPGPGQRPLLSLKVTNGRF